MVDAFSLSLLMVKGVSIVPSKESACKLGQSVFGAFVDARVSFVMFWSERCVNLVANIEMFRKKWCTEVNSPGCVRLISSCLRKGEA